MLENRKLDSAESGDILHTDCSRLLNVIMSLKSYDLFNELANWNFKRFFEPSILLQKQAVSKSSIITLPNIQLYHVYHRNPLVM